jgi:hypothetical protein
VFVLGRTFFDVGNLLVDVPFHPAAQGRVKLSDVADFHKPKIPSTKHQGSIKLQYSTYIAPAVVIWGLEFPWGLGFGFSGSAR